MSPTISGEGGELSLFTRKYMVEYFVYIKHFDGSYSIKEMPWYHMKHLAMIEYRALVEPNLATQLYSIYLDPNCAVPLFF